MTDLREPFVSVILPCLDEAESISACVSEARRGLDRANLRGEVLVVDNGSVDGSADLAEAAGARVVVETRRGYGAALRRGIEEAVGDIGIMADADMTYDLENLGQLVEVVSGGAGLVLANRLDGLNSGTMPILHRVLGTPTISFMLRRISEGRVSVRDSQSGYRAFDMVKIRELHLQSSGMEFASEMLVQAGAAGLEIDEIDLEYRPRAGESKLNTFEDGLRHLKLLALLDPRLVLLWPGLCALLLGGLLTGLSLAQPAGIVAGGSRWQPVFFGPIALVSSSLLLVSYLIVHVGAEIASQSSEHARLRNSVLQVGFGLFCVGGLIDGALFVKWVSGGETWATSVAFAGLAQALMLSGLVWMTSAFLYWLVQRQTEYAAGREASESSAAQLTR